MNKVKKGLALGLTSMLAAAALASPAEAASTSTVKASSQKSIVKTWSKKVGKAQPQPGVTAKVTKTKLSKAGKKAKAKITYRWYVDGKKVKGSTNRYKPTSKQAGKPLKVIVKVKTKKVSSQRSITLGTIKGKASAFSPTSGEWTNCDDSINQDSYMDCESVVSFTLSKDKVFLKSLAVPLPNGEVFYASPYTSYSYKGQKSVTYTLLKVDGKTADRKLTADVKVTLAFKSANSVEITTTVRHSTIAPTGHSVTIKPESTLVY